VKDRIYYVAVGGSERLVRASRGSVALSHAASTTHTVRVASQNDLERLLAKSVRVETAGEAPPSTAEQPPT